jgi:hypothetical protein
MRRLVNPVALCDGQGVFFVAASTRHISHSGHAHLRCIKCNIVAVTQRRRSRPGKIPGHQQPATPRTSSHQALPTPGRQTPCCI